MAAAAVVDPSADALTSARYRNITRSQCLARWFDSQTPQMKRKLRTHLSSADSHSTIIFYAGVTVGDLTFVLSNLPETIPDAVARTHARVGADAVFE